MSKFKLKAFDFIKTLVFAFIGSISLFFIGTIFAFLVKKSWNQALYIGQSVLLIMSALVLLIAAIGFLKRNGLPLSPSAKENFPFKHLSLQSIMFIIGVFMGLFAGMLDYLLLLIWQVYFFILNQSDRYNSKECLLKRIFIN